MGIGKHDQIATSYMRDLSGKLITLYHFYHETFICFGIFLDLHGRRNPAIPCNSYGGGLARFAFPEILGHM